MYANHVVQMKVSFKKACLVQVASAAEAPEACPTEERSQEAQHTQLAAVPESCADPSDTAELELESRLRLSQNSVGADEPAAGLPMDSKAGQAGSALGHSAQQELVRAQPTVLLPVEESADSENGQAADQTPTSSMRLPSPHIQREALSPLLEISNFRNQPAASQVRCPHGACQPSQWLVCCGLMSSGQGSGFKTES